MTITCSQQLPSMLIVLTLHVRINLQLYLYRTLTIAVIEIITNIITNTFIL